MQSGMNRYGLISGALLALATIVSAAGGGVGGGHLQRLRQRSASPESHCWCRAGGISRCGSKGHRRQFACTARGDSDGPARATDGSLVGVGRCAVYPA